MFKEKEFKKICKKIETLLADNKFVLVAIDGMSGSGKTTLSQLLKDKFGGNVFHMDDFFLQSHQRTPMRMIEAGGNVDYERFDMEVLAPTLREQAVFYRSYDCSTQKFEETRQIEPASLTIVEGVYSLHPYFGDVYQLKIFLEITEEEQLENLRKRESEQKLERFIKEWIPKENVYFKAFSVAKGCLRVTGVSV